MKCEALSSDVCPECLVLAHSPMILLHACRDQSLLVKLKWVFFLPLVSYAVSSKFSKHSLEFQIWHQSWHSPNNNKRSLEVCLQHLINNTTYDIHTKQKLHVETRVASVMKKLNKRNHADWAPMISCWLTMWRTIVDKTAVADNNFPFAMDISQELLSEVQKQLCGIRCSH